MNRHNRTLFLSLLFMFSALALANGAGRKFRAARGPEPVIGHYLVTLNSSVNSELSAATAEALARAYDGQRDPFASSDVRQFAITMLPGRARTLSADPRVLEVVEIAQPDQTAVPPPSSSAAANLNRQHLVPIAQDSTASGTYLYDGSGNIKFIGSDSFTYDSVGRLKVASVQGNQQSYNYDAFGNRTSATRAANAVGCAGSTACEATVTVLGQSNHLAEQTYDDAGNVKTGFGATYTYDGNGMVTSAVVGSDIRDFAYTAEDERIAVRQGLSWTWTVRDQTNKVLREFTSLEPTSSPLALSSHTWSKDYVWRDGQLLASVSQTASGPATYHYHLDHLGTPRLITGNGGVLIAKHAYYPFGAEIAVTPTETSAELMKFTGHERDLVAGDNHSVDYMHARYYNANLGRFLELDPSRAGVDLRNPESWNRYNYSLNNPLSYADRNGKWPTPIHGGIIDGAFGGLSNSQRQILKAASARVDSYVRGGQSAELAFQHGMRAWWQTPADAHAAADQFIAEHNKAAASLVKQAGGVTNAALDVFGAGLHTVTDRTSPTHKGEQIWTGGAEPGVTAAAGPLGLLAGAVVDGIRAVQHSNGEASITPDQYHAAVDAARGDYLQTFGQKAFQDATGCERVAGCPYNDTILQTLQKEK